MESPSFNPGSKQLYRPMQVTCLKQVVAYQVAVTPVLSLAYIGTASRRKLGMSYALIRGGFD